MFCPFREVMIHRMISLVAGVCGALELYSTVLRNVSINDVRLNNRKTSLYNTTQVKSITNAIFQCGYPFVSMPL